MSDDADGAEQSALPVVDYASPQANRADRPGPHEPTPGGQILLAAASGTFFLTLPTQEMSFFAAWGVMLWLLAIGMWVGYDINSRRTGMRIKGPDWWRHLVVTLAVLGILIGVRFGRCPHATYLLIGPVPLTMTGRACGNPRKYMNIFSWLYWTIRAR